MKKLRLYLLVIALIGCMTAVAQESATPCLAYGIRTYSPASDKTMLVSFSPENPAAEKELLDLSEYKIMAATCHDNVYYMIHSDDGIMASKLLKLDMNNMQIDIVKTYDWKNDVGGNIICSDMSFDHYTGQIYVAGYNMANGEIVNGEPTAPFAIFTINPATGDATLVGEQNERALVAITIDNEGTLLGVDDQGYLWDVSKRAGWPEYDLVPTFISPVGLQSMACNLSNGTSYWASYTADDSGNGISKLIKFTRTPDYEYEMEEIGAIGTNSEIIGMYIDPNPIPGNAPAVIENLTITPGEQGAAKANISWTNPTTTIDGNVLGLIDLNVYRDDIIVTTLKGQTPGNNTTWTDTDVPVGYHTYSVSASSEGTESRKVFTQELWIGEDVPGVPVVNAELSTDGKTIAVSWTAPAEGLHNGWFDTAALKYNVIRRPDNKSILENSTETSLSDTDIDEIHGYYYEVTATTYAGAGGTGKSAVVIAGNPHQVPYAPDFKDDDDASQWVVFNNDADEYQWYLYNGMWGGTNDAFFRYNPENKVNPETETNDWIISPAINLEKGKLYIAKYDLRLLGDLFPANSTFAMGKGQKPEAMIIELSKNDGEVHDIEWITHSTPFTVEETGAYNFGYQMRNAVPAQFYKFAIEETCPTDIAAGEFHGNTLATEGQESVYDFNVTNKGFYDIQKFTVELLDAEDNVLTSQSYDTPIASQASTTVQIAWTPAKAGNYAVRASVIVDGDGDASNNTSEPFSVSVLGNGTMLDITDGKSGTGYAPFYGTYLHSAVQTIYPAEMLGNIKGYNITAMKYYIYTAMGQDASTINFEVALACVDKADFADKTMIPEDQLTNVYNGKLQIDPKNKTVAIVFDRPFNYTGGNLCVFTRHDSEVMTPVYFAAQYASSDPLYTCLYRGDSRFDFSQTPNGSYHDLPNISLLLSKDDSGISNVATGNETAIRYSRSTGTLAIDGEYDLCRIYSVTGALINEVSGESEISVPAGSNVLIVEVVKGSQCIVKKIVTGR